MELGFSLWCKTLLLLVARIFWLFIEFLWPVILVLFYELVLWVWVFFRSWLGRFEVYLELWRIKFNYRLERKDTAVTFSWRGWFVVFALLFYVIFLWIGLGSRKFLIWLIYLNQSLNLSRYFRTVKFVDTIFEKFVFLL